MPPISISFSFFPKASIPFRRRFKNFPIVSKSCEKFPRIWTFQWVTGERSQKVTLAPRHGDGIAPYAFAVSPHSSRSSPAKSHITSRSCIYGLGDAADFLFLPFSSKSFNFFPRALQRLSNRFQKLQKISADLDFSMGYGRKEPKKLACRGLRSCSAPQDALRRTPSWFPLIHPGPRPLLIAEPNFLLKTDINGRRPSRQAFVWKNRITTLALWNTRTIVSRFAARVRPVKSQRARWFRRCAPTPPRRLRAPRAGGRSRRSR